MNGYSKMSPFFNKSRSMDFQGLSFSPPHPHPHPHPHEEAPPSPQPANKEKRHEEDGQRFGVILSRNCSSSASQRFRGDFDQKSSSSHGALQAVARRAFSMRKASSVRDGYWRIHDTGDGELAQEEEEEEVRPSRRKMRGGIFKACKRLFKFQF